MKEWYTPAELARLALPSFPSSKRGINKLAEREQWSARRSINGSPLARTTGGRGLEYNVALLPEVARHALAIASLSPIAHMNAVVSMPTVTERDAGAARLAVLKLHREHAERAGVGLRSSDDAFATLWNSGRIAAPDWLREQLKRISGKSLRRWRTWAANEPDRLRSKQGGIEDRAAGILWTANDGAIVQLVAGVIARQPHLTAAHVRAMIRATFGEEIEIVTAAGEIERVALPQERAVRRFIAEWKDKNKLALTRLTNPDKFKSGYRVSGLSRNEDVERLNQRWQIDASPADVLCVDGRYSIYVLIDVWSRRMTGLVTKTPRSEAVLLLLRKAILAWGVPEEAQTDNGSDFIAYAVKRALASLGIDHKLCDPFSPEQKGIVERAIGTMQRDLMPLLPGFVGHSVADRKAIEARKSFASRLGEKDDKAFCVELASTELQGYLDRWTDVEYGQRGHSGLPERMSPFARAASSTVRLKTIANERALDLLLAPVPGGDGVRVVGKQGLKIDGAFFLATTLMVGERVLVRHDPSDMGRVWCFSPDGSKFLAEAICPERQGVNRAEAVMRARAEQARIIKEQVEPIRKAAKAIKPRDMVEMILGQAEKDAGTVVMFPKPTEEHATPALEAAAEAAKPREERVRGPKLSEDARRAYDDMLADFAAGNQNTPAASQESDDDERRRFVEEFDRAPAFTAAAKSARVVDLPETPKHRFRRAYQIEEALKRNEVVAPDDLLWLGRYQAVPEYAGQKVTFDEFGLDWLFG